MRPAPAATRWNVEQGSGTLLGLAVAGGVMCVLALALPLYLGLATQQSVAGSADASALAAADVASGIAPGYPCDAARRVAAANATEVDSCEVDGLVVTVRVERAFWALNWPFPLRPVRRAPRRIRKYRGRGVYGVAERAQVYDKLGPSEAACEAQQILRYTYANTQP